MSVCQQGRISEQSEEQPCLKIQKQETSISGEALSFLEPRIKKKQEESTEANQKVRGEIMEGFEIWTLSCK